jgi:hypothetical protein
MDLGLGYEFRAARRPELIAAFYIVDAKVDEDAEEIRIAGRRSHDNLAYRQFLRLRR